MRSALSLCACIRVERVKVVHFMSAVPFAVLSVTKKQKNQTKNPQKDPTERMPLSFLLGPRECRPFAAVDSKTAGRDCLHLHASDVQRTRANSTLASGSE